MKWTETWISLSREYNYLISFSCVRCWFPEEPKRNLVNGSQEMFHGFTFSPRALSVSQGKYIDFLFCLIFININNIYLIIQK